MWDIGNEASLQLGMTGFCPSARDTSARSLLSWRWRACSRRSKAAFRAATRSAACASTSTLAVWFSVSQRATSGQCQSRVLWSAYVTGAGDGRRDIVDGAGERFAEAAGLAIERSVLCAVAHAEEGIVAAGLIQRIEVWWTASKLLKRSQANFRPTLEPPERPQPAWRSIEGDGSAVRMRAEGDGSAVRVKQAIHENDYVELTQPPAAQLLRDGLPRWGRLPRSPQFAEFALPVFACPN